MIFSFVTGIKWGFFCIYQRRPRVKTRISANPIRKGKSVAHKTPINKGAFNDPILIPFAVRQSRATQFPQPIVRQREAVF
jgi:hypothetical protein